MGCNFRRIPEDATPFYTSWLNSLTNEQIHLQRFRECTIICPSWFMHRSVFDSVAASRRIESCDGSGSLGAYVEDSALYTRVPEDLFFFLDHLEGGGHIHKVNDTLVSYRYSPLGWSVGVKSVDLQRLRIEYLQRVVLSGWEKFTIWGNGRDGRRFLSFLNVENAKKVVAFLDIDPGKIGTRYFCQKSRRHIPVIDFKEAVGPIIICVASKRSGALLEENIQSLRLTEGIDYFHFC